MKRIVLILLCLAEIFAFPSQVYALTMTRTVDGEGTSTIPGATGTYVGAGNFTDVQTNDGDTTYLRYTLGGTERHGWTFTNMAGGAINSVTVYGVIRGDGGGTNAPRFYTRIGSTDWDAANFVIDAVYTTYSTTWATSPATGLAWTMAEFNAAQFGLVVATPAVNVRLTQIYIVVDYTYAAPSVTTVAASSIGIVSATLNGNMTATGGDNVTRRGFVYDTVTRVAPGNVAPAASGYAHFWTDNATAFAAGAFSHITGGLTVATPYYFRAFARNSVGWAYGDELSFTTVSTPTVSSVAATNIAVYSAQLNGYVTNDGGQLCDIQFGWDTVSRGINFNLYANQQAYVNDTYATGSYPYYTTPASLALGTTYYYNVRIRNDAGVSIGVERSFTTLATVSKPTNLQYDVNAKEKSISLRWQVGSGATGTVVRWKLNSYPTSLTDGTPLYSGAGNSVVHTSVTPGNNYYYMAWGFSSTFYSSDNATIFATAGAYTLSEVTLPTNSTIPGWIGATDYTNMSNFPFYSWINTIADTFQTPRNSLWMMLPIIAAYLIAVLIYAASHSVPGAAIVGVAILGMSASAELLSLWVAVICAIPLLAVFVAGVRA